MTEQFTWTSGRITILHDILAVEIEVNEDIIIEVSADVERMLKLNVIPITELRTLAGRVTCISSLVHVWRPFVAMLWAPMYCHRSRCSFAPEKVWQSAVMVPPCLGCRRS